MHGRFLGVYVLCSIFCLFPVQKYCVFLNFMARGIFLKTQTYFKELFYNICDIICIELTTPPTQSAIYVATTSY